MTMLKLMALGARVLDAISLTGWSDISLTSPTTQGANEDRTLTWSVGGARNISVNYGAGLLEYRIDSGSWTAYSGAFSLTSGQTLGFRWTHSSNQSATTVTVTDASRGATLDTFDLAASGFDS